MPRDRYKDLYAAQLAKLDARKVVEDRIRLANSESVTCYATTIVAMRLSLNNGVTVSTRYHGSSMS